MFESNEEIVRHLAGLVSRPMAIACPSKTYEVSFNVRCNAIIGMINIEINEIANDLTAALEKGHKK